MCCTLTLPPLLLLPFLVPQITGSNIAVFPFPFSLQALVHSLAYKTFCGKGQLLLLFRLGLDNVVQKEKNNQYLVNTDIMV